MATPPTAQEANTVSQANLTALKDAANQKFINDAVTMIANAQQLGQTQIYLTTFDYCDIVYLMNYFIGLGYYITFPEYAPIEGSQPGELFGPSWIAYWESQLLPNNTMPHNPTRMGIAWVPPYTPPDLDQNEEEGYN